MNLYQYPRTPTHRGPLIEIQRVMKRALVADVELRSHESARKGDGPSPQETRQPAVVLQVVSVEKLEGMLHHMPAHEVLAELCEEQTCDCVSSVSLTDARCALVSYRQERGALASSSRGFTSSVARSVMEEQFERFTLDGEALHSVVAAAKELQVEFVWLDAWCYKFIGEYNHSHFCRTLHAVVSGVVAIVWLPRSKARSRGEYPFRLWCTFEAAVVQKRGLPVAIAGGGLSPFQSRLRRWGSFTPYLWTDGSPIDGLCRCNGLFLFVELANLYAILVNMAVGRIAEAVPYFTNLVLINPLMIFCYHGMMRQQVWPSTSGPQRLASARPSIAFHDAP